LTEHISVMEHDINNRKETCQSTGTALQFFAHMPPNLVNFGPEKAENGWRVNFCIGIWETLQALPYGRYITDSRQVLTHVM